jgi:hypothetical protein
MFYVFVSSSVPLYGRPYDAFRLEVECQSSEPDFFLKIYKKYVEEEELSQLCNLVGNELGPMLSQ